MKIIQLKQQEHNTKIGKDCPYYEPNITEDCLLELDKEIVGFYIKDISNYSDKLKSLISIANKEFRSTNVPKSKMDRSNVLAIQQANPGMTRSQARAFGTSQMSTILGSVPPKPQFKRPYPTISSVHNNQKSQTFIKAMWMSCLESEQIIKEITPKLYERQQELFENVKDEWKFGTMYTSSISNYNISAPFHRDTGNIVGSVNVILTKRNNSKGGCLNVPDYNVTFEQPDNSMLVYPAWKNVHGVTPIIPTSKGGYRNSLVFYPLKAFKGI
jgi:hypothetical protein